MEVPPTAPPAWKLQPGKQILLFGAGASYGCGHVVPHQPPLGADLYGRLCEEFPDTWGRLPTDLAATFSDDFEQGMDALWHWSQGTRPELMQQFGIYFSRFAPALGEQTLYGVLIDRLNSQRADNVLLATLNYDMLLDGEITRLGLGLQYLLEPGTGPLLLKLHGSCNWLLDFPGMNRFVALSADSRIRAPIHAVSTQEEVEEYLTGDTPLHPVICLYALDKPSPLCPDFFEHLRRQWAEAVEDARQIAIIGVRPNPSDAHIWQPLANTDARLLCIGDKGEYESWHASSERRGETVVLGDRFDAGLNPLWAELFA